MVDDGAARGAQLSGQRLVDGASLAAGEADRKKPAELWSRSRPATGFRASSRAW